MIIGYFVLSIRVVREYERAVVFRLGRALPTPKGPGIILVFRPFDQMVRVTAPGGARSPAAGRHHPRQRLGEGERGHLLPRLQADQGVLQVTDYLYATSQFAQTTLRSVLGQVELDELLSQRDKINGSSRRSSTSTPSPGA